jgi:hypothetical protein
MEGGEIVPARRVGVAAGIAGYARFPAGLDRLPRELASHTSVHASFGGLAGRRVLVMGSGQSAQESAAPLHESGATVEVVTRAPRFHRLRGGRLRRWLGPLSRLLYPSTDVGPPGINWIVAFPDLFRQLPRALQERLARRAIRPAGAGWLLPRLTDVRLTAGRTVARAVPARGGLSVSLDDGSVSEADHLLLATGYRVDIARYPFLPPALLCAISSVNGYPRLGLGLETSVPALHFLRAPAAASFGPVMRFVSRRGLRGPRGGRAPLPCSGRRPPQHHARGVSRRGDGGAALTERNRRTCTQGDALAPPCLCCRLPGCRRAQWPVEREIRSVRGAPGMMLLLPCEVA